MRIALVVPFTTKKPKKETSNTLLVPKGIMPGVLAQKECWALCDMMQVVNLCRLQPTYQKKTTAAHTSFGNSLLPAQYFAKIIKTANNIIGKV